jgi:hypothetical protein
MTLHEIEETLHTLIERHPGLDDGQLLTLLRAGGWEQKEIEEARMVFARGIVRSNPIIEDDNRPTEPPRENLPTLQEKPVFPPVVPLDHLLVSKNEEKKEEPSLVADVKQESREELPHNLPLKPFETSEHVWPFSRYRDIFYGESEGKPKPETVEKTPVPVSIPDPKRNAPVSDGSKVEVHITPTPMSKGDEKLVMLASMLFVIVILLLGYMYSNGRL